VFQHRACKTADLLTRETPDFCSAHRLAGKQPRLKSGGLQSEVSNAGEGLQINDVDELRSRVLTVELDQRVTDTAVRQ